MTDMRRVTISLPEDIDKRILKLKRPTSLSGNLTQRLCASFCSKGLKKNPKTKSVERKWGR